MRNIRIQIRDGKMLGSGFQIGDEHFGSATLHETTINKLSPVFINVTQKC
jgi:hypothetical protein